MSNDAPQSRFVSLKDAVVEQLPGKTHFWYCKPGMVRDTDFLFIRVQLPPGQAHSFHYHPKMEEILYFLSGAAEQWCDKEKKILGPGDSLYVPAGMVHATFNAGADILDFLAILSPAKSEGPPTIELGDQEPWKSMRK